MGRGNVRAALAASAVTLLGSASAFAFCRTTTCDAADINADCARVDGCSTKGIPLFWATQCVGFAVQKDGSPLRNISFSTFDRIVQTAFTQWTATTCDGTHPSFKIWDQGQVDCAEPEFNRNAGNSNTWMFRDTDWPYVGGAYTLAITTVTFELKSGKILDADVEVNSFSNKITTSEAVPVADLQSIATHESGHFLGLAHSSDSQATMFASYSPGNLSFRSLGDDDHAAICDVYPPDRNVGSCTVPASPNGYGFIRTCGAESGSTSSNLTGNGKTSGGCAIGRPGSGSREPWLVALALAAGAGLVVRRRRAQR